MLSEQEVRALLLEVESDRVERTSTVKDTDKFSRAVCAFANDLPGHGAPGLLIIGARDDGTLTGEPITDQLLQNLAALRSDGNILPPPALQVYKVRLEDGEVAVVEVQPSDIPPVRYKGRVCIRVGPRRAEANEQEERLLAERRSALVLTPDIHPVAGAGLDALSLHLFQEYRRRDIPADIIESNHRTIEEQLAALRCYDLKRAVVTVAGLVLFGTNTRHHLPGAYVQLLRFSGEEMSEFPIDQAELSGDLMTVSEQLIAKMKAYNTIKLHTSDGFQEEQRPDYPLSALRELMMNALIHRDYQSTSPVRITWFSDRVELQNPGGPFGEVSVETMTRQSAYRNPTIASAMKVMGYVNRFGYGIQRAQRDLAQDGHPALDFQQTDERFFHVIMRARLT